MKADSHHMAPISQSAWAICAPAKNICLSCVLILLALPVHGFGGIANWSSRAAADVVPNALNWTDTVNCVGEYQTSALSFTGINRTLSLRIDTVTSNGAAILNQRLYVGAVSHALPQTGSYQVKVSPNETVYFQIDPAGEDGTFTINVVNESDGGTVLDSVSMYHGFPCF